MAINRRLAESIPPFYNTLIMIPLDELESRIQTLLEIHLLKYLPGYKPEDKVFQQLAVAMHKSLREQDGMIYAPNVYILVTHPTTLERWLSTPDLVRRLGDVLRSAGEEAGFHFITKPTVSTASDPDLEIDEIYVIASFSAEIIPGTQELPVNQPAADPRDRIQPDAFLIQGGTKIIPLDRQVINIGRRLDNQLVIDDPRVSRLHAQLRVTKGNYVLFDLNSTGGTYINGQRTIQSVLHPGDVISLAGVTLIFSQDLPVEPSMNQARTEPNLSNPADHLTDNFHQPKITKARKTSHK